MDTSAASVIPEVPSTPVEVATRQPFFQFLQMAVSLHCATAKRCRAASNGCVTGRNYIRGQITITCRLKIKFQRQLNDSWRDARCLNDAKSTMVKRCVRIGELCMIKNVKELRAEFQISRPIRSKGGALNECEIEIHLVGTSDNTRARVAESCGFSVIPDYRGSGET